MSIKTTSSSTTPDLTDRQWYLSGDPGDPHLNLGGITEEYDGSGVTVGIWDEGIEYSHPDLKQAYDKDLHVVIDGEVHNPKVKGSDHGHGTAVAGIIAAADDGVGTVGIAPGATISMTDILSPRSNIRDKDSLYGLSGFDVTNHSWGYIKAWEVGGGYRTWKKHLEKDLIESTTEGRDGLGTINVFSAGNEKYWGFNTNIGAMAQTHHGITVAGVNTKGKVTDYSTPGSTVLVSAIGNQVWTTDLTGSDGDNTKNPDNDNPWADYTTFRGTSAAAPQVSAIAALMLEANPDLGWRDVQTILAASARHTGSPLDSGRRKNETDDWDFNGAENWNGGGMHYSNDYGFGLVDAHAAIRMAETWDQASTSDNLESEAVDNWSGNETLWLFEPIEISFDVTSDISTEMVSVDLTFARAYLNAYRIKLTSPEGTRSILSRPIDEQPYEDYKWDNYFYDDIEDPYWLEDVDEWTFSSREFLGEDPNGEWTLEITERMNTWDWAKLKSADLIISGADEADHTTLIYTNEFSDLADGEFGHSDTVSSQNGTYTTLNAAAVTTNTRLNFEEGEGRLDRVEVTLPDSFASIFTGDGDDRITGSDADETISTMRGSDRLKGKEGDDTLKGGDGRDDLSGGQGNDVLHGGNGSDDLRGGADNDRLVGNRSADTLDGGSGHDGLSGGRGHDILRDGSGSDTMRGGLGDDTFVLTTDTNTDYVTDFENESDVIQLRDLRWSDLEIDERGSEEWEVRYDGDLLLVSGDADDFTGLSRSDFLFT
ncbi:S8 family serine peptidase [Amaricoccus tamworthensis]|uniref:S8 family serine peptidase n=1 Tax=Amaricoccus tamworthensis TaxID=57002 RepID=UPI003C7BD849